MGQYCYSRHCFVFPDLSDGSVIFSDLGSFVAPSDGEKKVIFVCLNGILELDFLRSRFPSFGLSFFFRSVSEKLKTKIKISVVI